MSAHEKSDTRQRILEFLRERKVATMQELKKIARTSVGMTVYRHLKKLSYLTSYSHNGQYYSLVDIVKFDKLGLWNFDSIRFSRYGTLLETLGKFVTKSETGFYARELEELLHVSVKETLLRLFQRGKISRERVARSYLYCAKNSSVRRRQLAARREVDPGVPMGIGFCPESISDEVKAAIILFTALLNEQQRRLFAGVEALQFGRDAERWIAHLLGLHPQTVAKGKHEILEGTVPPNRIRKKGAGRHRVEKKRQRSAKQSKN